MKDPTKKLLNLTRRYNKVKSEYSDAVDGYIETCEPMYDDAFWPYLDRLAKNIEERKPYMGNPIKSGVHNTFLEIRADDKDGTPLRKWVRCVYFYAAYRDLVDKLYDTCFDMVGVEKSDDRYGDWVDALPLAGKRVVDAIFNDDLIKYSKVYTAVELDRIKLSTLIMDGENYVRSELVKWLIKGFANAVYQEDVVKNSPDMVPTWI